MLINFIGNLFARRNLTLFENKAFLFQKCVFGFVVVKKEEFEEDQLLAMANPTVSSSLFRL